MHNERLATNDDLDRVINKFINWLHRKFSYILFYIDKKLD